MDTPALVVGARVAEGRGQPMTPSERLREMVAAATSDNAAPWEVTEFRTVRNADGQVVDHQAAALIAIAPEAVSLLADIDEALAYIEWIHDGSEEPGPEHNVCPACGLTEARGHDRSCSIAPVLARLAALTEQS